MDSKLILYNDASLAKGKAKTGDLFELEDRLRPIYQAILSKETPTPFTAMFSGGWGTGKTSAMRWMEEHLRELGSGEHDTLKIDSCWFYPWKYQSADDVWKGLIAEVIVASIDFERVDAAKVIMAARQFGRFLGGSFVRVLSAMKVKGKITPELEAEFNVKEALSGIIEEYGKHVTPQEAYYNVFEKSLEEWIRETYKEGKSRMVVFIDDLDRCLPAIALQVLEAIKLYLNIPNLVVIVGVDRQVIDAVVVKHYRDNLGDAVEELGPKARQYLDKMFQVEIPISPQDRQVKKFIDHQLEATLLWHRLSKEHQGIFSGIINEIADINPRNVLRSLNAAIVGAGSSEDELLVAQNVQVALVKTVLQRLPEREFGVIHDLCLREEGRRFLAKWSQAVRIHPRRPTYLRPEELSGRDETGSDDVHQPAGHKAELAGRFVPFLQDSGDLTVEHLEALASAFPAFKKLLAIRILGLLMRIPFPEDEQSSGMGEHAEAWNKLRAIVAEKNRLGLDQVTDEYLRSLTQLDLSISGTDELLAAASELKNLQALNLFDSEVSATGLGHLSESKELLELDLDSTRIGDEGLVWVGKLPKIRSLNLTSTAITGKGLRSLSSLRNLKELSVDDTRIDDEGVEQLVSLFTGLKTLDVSLTGVTDRCAPSLGTLNELSELFLNLTKLSDKGVAELSSLKNLRSLDAGITALTDRGIGSLSALTDLLRLNLSFSKVSEKGLAELNPLGRLAQLLLGNTNIGDSALRVIEQFPNLRMLYLNNTLITSRGLEQLLGLPKLESLSLAGTRLDDEAVPNLSRLTNLTQLFLPRTGISDHALRTLREALPKCRIS